MTRTSIVLLALTVRFVPDPPAAAPAVAQAPGDRLAIVVHRSNVVDAVSLVELRRIFMLETQSWPNGRKITLVLREKGQPDRAHAIRLVCRLSEADFDRHVLFQTFRGAVSGQPRSIRSAAAMIRFVFNAPGAIGHVWASEVDSSTKVLRIDGRLPSEAGYPLRVPVAPARVP
jgi:hypothetical protein